MNTSALLFRTSAAVCSEMSTVCSVMSTVCSEVKQCGEDGVVRGWRGIQAGAMGTDSDTHSPDIAFYSFPSYSKTKHIGNPASCLSQS